MLTVQLALHHPCLEWQRSAAEWAEVQVQRFRESAAALAVLAAAVLVLGLVALLLVQDSKALLVALVLRLVVMVQAAAAEIAP